MTVRRLLKGKGSFVPVIRSDLRLSDVVDQLDIDDVGALVVTDDKRKILGIITERDIARGLKSHGRDVVDKPLLELMTRDVISIDIGEPLSKVLELMDQYQIHYVPVTEGGWLCGIMLKLDENLMSAFDPKRTSPLTRHNRHRFSVFHCYRREPHAA